jgi:hypothetical protein
VGERSVPLAAAAGALLCTMQLESPAGTLTRPACRAACMLPFTCVLLSHTVCAAVFAGLRGGQQIRGHTRAADHLIKGHSMDWIEVDAHAACIWSIDPYSESKVWHR